MPEEIPNQEPTIDEQVRLAEKLRESIERRNVVENAYPGMEDLSIFLDSDPEHRKEHTRLWKEYNEARKIFDEKVVNKLWLVKHLREIGEDDLGDMIESMFGLEKLQY